MRYGYHKKTQNLVLISDPLKKLQKNPFEQSYQRKCDSKMEFLTFITVCKSFRPITIFGEITSISGLGGSICQKSQRLFYPNVYGFLLGLQTNLSCEL
jgi:hypothetical protein